MLKFYIFATYKKSDLSEDSFTPIYAVYICLCIHEMILYCTQVLLQTVVVAQFK